MRWDLRLHCLIQKIALFSRFLQQVRGTQDLFKPRFSPHDYFNVVVAVITVKQS